MQFTKKPTYIVDNSSLVFIVSSPPEIGGWGWGKGGWGYLVFEIWTKRGVMKNLLRNRGLVKRGGGVLLERGWIPNCFISFP